MIEAIWLTSLALLLAFTIVLIGQLLAVEPDSEFVRHYQSALSNVMRTPGCRSVILKIPL